ncbi:phosphatase 2C-like domain-containing protein, partial [Paraphysoderma sedebokerense]
MSLFSLYLCALISFARFQSSMQSPVGPLRVLAPVHPMDPKYSKWVDELQILRSQSQRPSIKYDLVGAAFCKGKHEMPPSQLPIKMDPKCGEDAYFIKNDDDHLYFGVADGVGGWATDSKGEISSRDFSWSLMNHCRDSSGPEFSPKKILDLGYQKLRNSGILKGGSSTAVILDFNKKTGQLSTANLGDSGYIIIRDGRVAFKSVEMQHYFNCPYQLSLKPGDLPRNAYETTHQLVPNDIVIAATDGLFDNLYEEDILRIVKQEMAKITTKPDRQALHSIMDDFTVWLTLQARRNMLNENRLSPFTENYNREHGTDER